MINSILDFLSCKKCLNEDNKSEIILNNNVPNENNVKINEDEEIDFEKENQQNMEFIQNIQNEIDKENLKIKNELDNIRKEKTLLEDNINKKGNFFNKKE